MYRIKEFGELIGVSPETIRHYERMGVLPDATRTENGYRVYTDDDAERLHFVSRARQLDFPLSKIAEIMSFRDEGTPPCSYVRELIAEKIHEVKARISELEKLHDELTELHEISKNLPEELASSCICQIIETTSKPRKKKESIS